MRQGYQSLSEVVNRFREKILNQKAQVQKIYSTPHYAVLSVRFAGETNYLYLGRGSGYEGVWNFDKQVPSWSRVRDGYLEYLRSHLKGAVIVDFEVDEKDRIVIFRYFQNKVEKYLSLFWKGRELYYINAKRKDESRFELYAPWATEKNRVIEDSEVREQLLSIWDEIGRTKLGEKKKIDYSIEKYLIELGKLSNKNKDKKKKMKFLQKKRENIEKDLRKVATHAKLERAAKEITDLPDESLTIEGIKIKFGFGKTFYQKRDLLFSKVKGLKKGEGILEKRIRDVEIKIEALGKEDIEIRSIDKIKIVRPVTKKTAEVSSTKIIDNIDHFKYNEIDLYVGKTSDANDTLRKNFAKKNDFWFHLSEEKGAHLILKIEHVSDICDELFDIIGSILRDYSKVSKTEVSVVFTQVKNIKGVKGSRGAVLFKKEKYRVIHYDIEWKEKIKR